MRIVLNDLFILSMLITKVMRSRSILHLWRYFGHEIIESGCFVLNLRAFLVLKKVGKLRNFIF